MQCCKAQHLEVLWYNFTDMLQRTVLLSKELSYSSFTSIRVINLNIWCFIYTVVDKKPYTIENLGMELGIKFFKSVITSLLGC